jgi:hypothetical protein
MVKIKLLILLSLLLSTVVQAASITVKTSRNPVALDDSFHLIYEADSSVDDDPDFTPIYQYLDVLSSSQSTNMRSINGSWSMKKTWDLSVIAKDVGKITIPSIKFGQDISPAIQLTVTSSTSPNSATPDGQSTVPAKIFLESSLDKKTGWVQSQYIYTIRLLRTVSITGASLTDPVTSDPDAIINKITEDNYQTTRNGINYEIFERSYAIFPQKSGTIKIDPVTFEGRINATQPRSIFDQFRMSGQLKRLRSKAVKATVKAAPGTINLQDWLPATDLQLIEQWSDDIQNLKAGEPVTRTILLAAEGLTGAQLPDLVFDELKNIKQYPDKAVIEDRHSAEGVTGIKQIKIALLPTLAGSYILPEIKLRWWNTKTNKEEVVSIPQTEITVSASVAEDIYTDTNVQTGEMVLQNEQAATNNGTQTTTAVQPDNEPYWKWLSLFFAFAWLITLVLFFRKKDPGNIKNKVETISISVKTAASAVVKHGKNNDEKNTRDALIKWAQAFYDNKSISNITQITEHCSAQLSQQIKLLNHVLYSTDNISWNGEELLAAFKEEQRSNIKQKEKPSSVLKPLYNR